MQYTVCKKKFVAAIIKKHKLNNAKRENATDHSTKSPTTSRAQQCIHDFSFDFVNVLHVSTLYRLMINRLNRYV